MAASFSQFIRERQYLHNVSPATLEWYKHSFKWLRTENPSEHELKDAVMRMRAKGLKPTGCNSAIRAINAYLKWSGSQLRVLYLKEDQRVLTTFMLPGIKKLLCYRPKPTNFYQRRLHLLILFLLDEENRSQMLWEYPGRIPRTPGGEICRSRRKPLRRTYTRIIKKESRYCESASLHRKGNIASLGPRRRYQHGGLSMRGIQRWHNGCRRGNYKETLRNRNQGNSPRDRNSHRHRHTNL